MANWSNPTLTSTYTNFLSEVKDRDVDLALQFDGTTSSNLATGTIRWDSSASRWKKWNGSAWAELTGTYALTGLSTTGAATIGTTLGVTGVTTLSGGGTSTTPLTADNSTAIATTAFVKAQNYAPLASPSLTGTPLAPTAATDTNTTQIATTAFVVAQIADDALLKSGGTMTGAIVLAGDPTVENNPTTKHWVEARAFKDACRVATTTALTVTATTTTLTNSGTLAAISIDGISLSSGDRVLVKDQGTPAQNGIYTVTTVGSGAIAWVLTRGTDTDVWNDLVAAVTAVEQGTANDNTMWLSTTALGGTLGTTPVTWQLVSNAQVAALAAFASTGILARTAANTFAARSVAVSGTGLSVSNADGVSGNPTIASNATNANTASTIVARDASGNFSAGTIALAGLSYTSNIDTTSTGYLEVPAGTTAERPGTGAAGMIRYNSQLGQFEGYGAAWGTIGGGAKGGGSDQVFFENDQTVNTSYSITAGKNAVTAGPVTVASGVTVTIPSGSTWSIV
jgi:hypothetical protein